MTFEGLEFLGKIKIEAPEIIENKDVNSLKTSNIKVEEDDHSTDAYFDSFCDNIKIEIDESLPEQHNISPRSHDVGVNNEIPFVDIKVEEFHELKEGTLSNGQENDILVSNKVFPIKQTENVLVDTTLKQKDTNVNFQT